MKDISSKQFLSRFIFHLWFSIEKKNKSFDKCFHYFLLNQRICNYADTHTHNFMLNSLFVFSIFHFSNQSYAPNYNDVIKMFLLRQNIHSNRSIIIIILLAITRKENKIQITHGSKHSTFYLDILFARRKLWFFFCSHK